MSAVVTIDVHLVPAERVTALASDVRIGLTATPKALPPVWFYDERGSLLFDEITRLPEYYLTRAEHSILTEHASDIAARCEVQSLVELGSGTSEKTRLLLDALTADGMLSTFVPFDVSEEVLREAAAGISGAYQLDVHAVVGDFHRHLPEIPTAGRRLVAFLGSTIGNLTPTERQRFLFDLDATMGHDEWLLFGADLVKDPRRLIAAYDDAQGVTAAFNKNVLSVINRELDASFDLDAFEHVAVWDEDERRVEMRLRSTRDQRVAIDALELDVPFAAGETMRTEISSKFTVEEVRTELSEAGFVVEEAWTDAAGDFLVTLARPYC